MTPGLSAIDHVVVLMLENRSFDHMLGWLYADQGNRSPLGHPFEGLTGQESNPDANGQAVPVFRITPDMPNAYFMPGVNPGEGYQATNRQLFDTSTPPDAPPAAANQGFVKNFTYTMGWETRERPAECVPGTEPSAIMGCFAPETLPVLSALARGFAVCDHWYGSAPTETLPNRAFACAGTSQGHLDDHTKSYTVPSIFGALTQAGVSWAIHGYLNPPLTAHNFPDTVNADPSHYGVFADFQRAAAAGQLAAYTFLEPGWGGNGQNDQHPVSDVSAGERYILAVYRALRDGPAWERTLLIVTYDEHGGCYDHVPPPWTATPPDDSAGQFDFDFRRFGPRVPAVLVSPLIAAGTVFRVPDDGAPLDHTAILKTLQQRWNLPPLTRRDAAAPALDAVLTLSTARTDDPLAGVVAPVSRDPGPGGRAPTHLQQLHAQMVSELPVDDGQGGTHHRPPVLASSAEHDAYIRQRTAAWHARPKPGSKP